MTLDSSHLPEPLPEDAPCAPVRESRDTLRLLAERRSSKPFHLGAPGPSPSQLDALLRLATRVPDHGKLAPWRFIVLSGDGAVRAGILLAEIAANKENASPETVAAAHATFTRAPMAIAVVSTAKPHPKIPEWEQILSAGAVVQSLLVAAHALGFGAVWLTGWVAYDEAARKALGVAGDERIAGFVHIGTQMQAQGERARPDLGKIVTRF